MCAAHDIGYVKLLYDGTIKSVVMYMLCWCICVGMCILIFTSGYYLDISLISCVLLWVHIFTCCTMSQLTWVESCLPAS